MLLCAMQALIATSLSAQGIIQQPQLPDPEATGRFRLGFIRFTPSIAITNLGVDTNVFNELEDPKQDFTVSFGPQAEFWSRFGPRALLYGKAGVHYNYFQEYDSQRSFGTEDALRLEVDLGRLTPFADGTYINTRTRPGFEIDERARFENLSGRAGVGIRVLAKTKLLLWAKESRFRYDDGSAFLEDSLSTALDRDSRSFGGGAEIELTPLTTLLVDVESGEDRFLHSPVRDADTYRVLSGFRFKPFALINGTATFGYRDFETLSPLVPDFGGVVAQVNLAYTLRATRFGGTFNRDVTYSFQTTEPYYLQTDWLVSATQRITTAWDVVGRVGHYTLDYEIIGVPGARQRTDSGRRFGGGVGYTLGQFVRLGLDVDYAERRSEAVINRDYDGIRAGMTITYGTKQQ